MERKNIKKSGKIGRLVSNVRKELNSINFSAFNKELQGFEFTINKTQEAKYVENAIKQLEFSEGQLQSICIMEKCGRDCFNQHKLAKQLKQKTLSIEEIIKILNKGSVSIKIEDKNTIIAEYSMCFCHVVKKTKNIFHSDTYCHCSVGWWKGLFEAVLEKPVVVNLVQTIITGGKTCKFIIHI
jgi:predicted hydrocarbon binding protein